MMHDIVICPECARRLTWAGTVCAPCEDVVLRFRAMARGWWRRG